MASVYDDIPDHELGQKIRAKFAPHFDHVEPAELGKQAKLHPATQYDGPPMPDPPPSPAKPTSSAAMKTVPEKSSTIRLQLDQLKQGIRRVVMFPKGTPVPFSAKMFAAHRLDTKVGVFFYNPKLISAADIQQAISADKLQDILGDKDLGYGAPAKDELTPPVKAVVSKTPDMQTVQAVATDAAHAPETITAAKKVTPPGGSVGMTTPDRAVKARGEVGNSGDIGSEEIPAGQIPSVDVTKPKKMKFRKMQRLGLK